MRTHRFGRKIKPPATIAIKHQIRKLMFEDAVKKAGARAEAMTLIRTAPTIVPQTAADAMPINIIAARRATESSSPSSWAREISEITIAGATLLKGTGVSSRTAVNNRTMTPTARFA
jgi:hypothetical protein